MTPYSLTETLADTDWPVSRALFIEHKGLSNNLAGRESGAYLDIHIGAAGEKVENHCGIKLRQTDTTALFRPGSLLEVPPYAVGDITFSVKHGDTWTDIDAIEVASYSFHPAETGDEYRAVYTRGFETVPEIINLAMLRVASDFYDQRGESGIYGAPLAYGVAQMLSRYRVTRL